MRRVAAIIVGFTIAALGIFEVLTSRGVPAPEQSRRSHLTCGEARQMTLSMDVLYVALSVAFFALTWALVALCERL